MNLNDLRTEVFAHGFDPPQFSNSRITQYLNDAYLLVCRRVDYYLDEGSQTTATDRGTSKYPFPTDFARGRDLIDQGTNQTLPLVSLNAIDSSSQVQGRPTVWAVDGSNLHLYPTPDGVYTLLFRYWKLPALLVNDADTPNLPADWHRMLWYWACKECYVAEDDVQYAQYWEQQFEKTLSEFAADQKFPESEPVSQAASMWDSEQLPGRSFISYW